VDEHVITWLADEAAWICTCGLRYSAEDYCGLLVDPDHAVDRLAADHHFARPQATNSPSTAALMRRNA
jgi:hypothetical protein